MAADTRALERRTKGRQVPGEAYLRKRPGSPHWQISFRIDDYRVRESAGTEDKLEAAKLADLRWKEVWREVKLGEIAPGQMTLAEAFLRFHNEVAQHSAYGMRGQRYHMKVLAQAIGHGTFLADLDDRRINEAVQWMRSRVAAPGRPAELSGSTINRYLTTLNVVCTRAQKLWGIEVGAWTKASHALKEPGGREVFLTHEQAHVLLTEASGHLRPILLMELMTGLRLRNVVEMDWNTISLDLARAILIQKGDRRLTVSLPPPAVELLTRIEPDQIKRTGPVFWFGNPAVGCECPRCKNVRYTGQPIRSVKRTFATAIADAGLMDLPAGRLRFHDLRHTYASWLLAECSDLRIVQEALGHKNIATTARYAHLLPGRKEAAVSASADKLMSGVADPSGHKKSTEGIEEPRNRNRIKRLG